MKQEKTIFHLMIRRLNKRFFLLSIALGVTILVIYNMFAMNQNPGNVGKFEYIGKNEVGCYVFCSQLPSVEYYFATDMTRAAAEDYLRRYARVIDTSQDIGYLDGIIKIVEFESKKTGKFSITFYDDRTSALVREREDLKNTANRYVISIDGSPRDNRNDLVILKEAVRD